jgi:hypothetical protein
VLWSRLAASEAPDFQSSLASRCHGAEDYRDCDCSARVVLTHEDVQTRVGVRRVSMSPTPSSPWKLSPQHHSVCG